MKSWMLRLLCLLTTLATAGCIKVRQLVLVNPDGSGNIVVSTVFLPEAVVMVTQMSGLQDAGAGAADATTALQIDPFYDEDTLRAAASQFGEGVRFTKAQRVDKDGTRGSIAVYAFDDISRVRINTRQNMDVGDAMSAMKTGVDAAAGDHIRFAFTKGDTSRLTVLTPQLQEAGGQARRPAQAGKSAEGLPPDLSALGGMGSAMAMQMFKGMEMDFAVQVKGRVIRHNASHPDAARPDRFQLLGLNLDALMTSPEFQALARQNVAGDQADMMKKLYALPGARIETNREVVIEFK